MARFSRLVQLSRHRVHATLWLAVLPKGSMGFRVKGDPALIRRGGRRCQATSNSFHAWRGCLSCPGSLAARDRSIMGDRPPSFGPSQESCVEASTLPRTDLISARAGDRCFPAGASVVLDCRALRALANEEVVAGNRPHPPAKLEPSPPDTSIVVLLGRATHVP
jgi:hypothetical protein